MSKTALLFIGGPLHGERRAVYSPRLDVPVYNGGLSFTEESETERYLTPTHSIVTYTRRRVSLNSTVTSIMAPVAYTDEAVVRALADFIEGVDRK